MTFSYAGRARSVTFSSDGRRVVVGNYNGKTKIYKTEKIWEAVDWTLTKEEFPQYQLKCYQAWLKRNETTK